MVSAMHVSPLLMTHTYTLSAHNARGNYASNAIIFNANVVLFPAKPLRKT
jgi:hypothetical protein